MSTSNGKVHESEVQRQHVRIQLPLRVQIGKDLFETEDWSNSGLSLKVEGVGEAIIRSHFVEGSTLSVTLVFQFHDFGLTLPIDLEIRYVNMQNKRIGCRFTNFNKRQLSVLQYLVHAYVSGELVQISGLLDVAARHQTGNGRVNDTGASRHGREKGRVMRKLRSVAITAAALLLLAYVLSSLYARLFVVNAHSAMVNADAISIVAPSSGKLTYQSHKTDDAVKKGEPLILVTSQSGNVVTKDSPCDCLIKERLYENDHVTHSGEPVLLLTPKDAKPFVEAAFRYADAVHLAAGQRVTLRFPAYGSRHKGTIVDIKASGNDSDLTRVTITPENGDRPLDLKRVGEPVEVAVDTFLGMM